jgi:hypothetical protein
MSDLDEYHRLFAYWRASGLSESAAHAKAEEILESQPFDEKVRED